MTAADRYAAVRANQKAKPAETSAVLLGDHEPNSPEWHATRATGIGASEIAAVVGLSPFESPFSLWHRKKGNLPGADPNNPLFYWGHALEPLVADHFAERHPEFTVAPHGTAHHSERRWQLASLDRALYGATDSADVPHPRTLQSYVGTNPLGVLEIKTTRYGDNWGPDGSDQIPIHVRCQVTQQMDVFSAPFAWVAVLIGGNDYREYQIDYSEDDAHTLRTAGAAFWDSLQNDAEPPIDASFETFQAVRELHPDINGEDIEIDAQLWVDYAQTKHVKAQTDADHREAKAALLHAMGDARRAIVNGTPLLRRQPGRGGSVSLYEIKESA